jgi:hypothetical protein
MTNPGSMTDLARLEDEIDEAILHCANNDERIAELRRRQAHLKEEMERLHRLATGQATLH